MNFEKIEEAYTLLLENTQLIQNSLSTNYYDALIEQNGMYLDGKTDLTEVTQNNQTLKALELSKEEWRRVYQFILMKAAQTEPLQANHQFTPDSIGFLLIFLMDLISYYFRSKINNENITYGGFIRKNNIINIGIPLLLLVSLLYVSNFVTITGERFIIGLKQLKVLVTGLLNPDLDYIGKMFGELMISLEIALFATIFAALTAIFTSYLSSINLFGKYKAMFGKIIINIFRTFPPIIVALIFFRGFGPGIISSFFALYFYTVGVMTKMYSEVLESIKDNILLTTKSLGLGNFTSYIKIIFNGYFPEFVSIVLYRFESNIKNSTILGMVGAGGIGHLLVNNIEYRNWNRISTLLVGLCLTIIIVENISYLIRLKVKK